MKNNDPIIIHVPSVVKKDGKARIVCDIEYDKNVRNVWFEVDEEYAEFLCTERSDAYVVGLLNLAMREGRDIVCDTPVTEELLYQLNAYLIPSLARHGKAMYATKIIAKTDSSPLPNYGAVGTGLSCGVDSLHAIAKHWKCDYHEKEITHLAIYNVGAFEHHDKQYEYQVEHARLFCEEYGFKIVEANSNFHLAFPQCHLLSHTYRNCFCVLLLQKLWKTYFIGSWGRDFSDFSLVNNDVHDCAYYELLSLQCFSHSHLKLYSDGGAITRFDKVKLLALFPPAHKYLHVCVMNSGPNCNKCTKCRRTLFALDALGALDKFARVFDIECYRKNRHWYMRHLARHHLSPIGDKMVDPAYQMLKAQRRGPGLIDIVLCYPKVVYDYFCLIGKKNSLVEKWLRLVIKK